MARRMKELMVEELALRFGKLHQTGCLVVDYSGMTAEDSVRARRAMREFAADMVVVKNSLFNLVLKRLELEQLSSLVEGPTAIVWAADPITAARGLKEVVKTCGALKVRGGLAEGRLLGSRAVDKLADIPDRETLLAQVATCVRQPAQRFVGLLQGAMAQLVSVLEELRKKRQAEFE